MKLPNWIHWPSTPTNDLAAWYTILWRAPFVLLLYTGLAFCALTILIAYGRNDATYFWRTHV